VTQDALFQSLYPRLGQWPLKLAAERLEGGEHGDFARWQEAIDSLPAPSPGPSSEPWSVKTGAIFYPLQGTTTDFKALATQLQQLHPWRKGPFALGSLFIDSEWRSDQKWNRLSGALGRLDELSILDIGCGNGYFGWQMLNAGAKEVIGIDPMLLFCMQHLAIQHFFKDPRHHVLPLGVEEIPNSYGFDLVLSMGVLYHRKDAKAHLDKVFALTRPGGRAVVETLIVEGERSLTPPGRYARMRNVWEVPCIPDLYRALALSGFQAVELIDVSTTTPAEQRSTPWMHFDSLEQALDAQDPGRTIEGHPAPRRAIMMASRPS